MVCGSCDYTGVADNTLQTSPQMLQLGYASGVHPGHANRHYQNHDDQDHYQNHDDQDHDEYHDYDHDQDQRVASKLCQNSVTLGE